MIIFARVSPGSVRVAGFEMDREEVWVAGWVTGGVGSVVSNWRSATDCPKCEYKKSRGPETEVMHPRQSGRMLNECLDRLRLLIAIAGEIRIRAPFILDFTVFDSYRLRRSIIPAPERVPPPSSIITQPADVSGISRLALLVSEAIVLVLGVVAGRMVLGVVVADCAVVVA